MTALADVDGIKISIQVCVWLCFPPLQSQATLKHKSITLALRLLYTLVTYSDVKIFPTTHSQVSLNTSCIVNLFNPIELWSIAMPYDGQ